MRNLFDDEWQEAFKDASKNPPDEVWERIEQELDKKKKGGIIFWSNPMLWSGVAASIMLILGTLWLSNVKVVENLKPEMASTASDFIEKSKEKSTELEIKTGQLGDRISDKIKEVHDIFSAKAAEYIVKDSNFPKLTAFRNEVLNSRSVEHVTADILLNKKINTEEFSEKVFASPNATLQDFELTKLRSKNFESFVEISPLARLNLIVESKPQLAQTRKKDKIWFGFTGGGAPFNPNLNTPNFQSQAMSAAAASDDLFKMYPNGANGNVGTPDETPMDVYTGSSSTNVQSSFSKGTALNLGIRFGKKLKKKFSVESGLLYSKSRAWHNSNVYALDLASGEAESYATANYVLNDGAKRETLVSTNERSEYEYNFLSIPVLLNYNILESGRLSVDALAGLSNEFLLGGNIKKSSGEKQSFSNGNSNFKTYNLAGNAGLRLSYAIAENLDVCLGGGYQRFITSGIKSDSDVSFKPSMLGVNLGLIVTQ